MQFGLKDDRNRDGRADEQQAQNRAQQIEMEERRHAEQADEHEDADEDLNGARTSYEQQHVVNEDARRDHVDDVGNADVEAQRAKHGLFSTLRSGSARFAEPASLRPRSSRRAAAAAARAP